LFGEYNKNARKFSARNISSDKNYPVLDLFRECNKNGRKFSARTLTTTRITRFLLLQFY
jgi:hypothetical protein